MTICLRRDRGNVVNRRIDYASWLYSMRWLTIPPVLDPPKCCELTVATLDRAGSLPITSEFRVHGDDHGDYSSSGGSDAWMGEILRRVQRFLPGT